MTIMDWLTVLPPLIAVTIAVWKKAVIPALFAALFTADWIMTTNPLLAFPASIDRLTSVFSSTSNTRILLFSLLIGAFLALVKLSGGVNGFVDWLLKRNIARTPR